MSDDLTDAEVRNASLCLLAADWALCDEMTPEDAVAYSRRLEACMNDDPLWSDGKHHGDCTQQPTTCVRCLIEDAERQARERFDS